MSHRPGIKYLPLPSTIRALVGAATFLLFVTAAIFGRLFRAGASLLAGTDTPNPFVFPGFGLHDELALMVEGGVTPLGALQAATRNPAVFLGIIVLVPCRGASMSEYDERPKDEKSWKRLYEAALLEFDPHLLLERIAEAEKAIDEQALAQRINGDGNSEKAALQDARVALGDLKKMRTGERVA